MSKSPFAQGRLLVVAFEGWNDAGEAASGAVKTLKSVLDLSPVVEIESEDYFDYQFNRPVVTNDDEGVRKIVWPSRKETWITSVMVFIMVLLAAAFFWIVDTGLGFASRYILALGQ